MRKIEGDFGKGKEMQKIGGGAGGKKKKQRKRERTDKVGAICDVGNSYSFPPALDDGIRTQLRK